MFGDEEEEVDYLGSPTHTQMTLAELHPMLQTRSKIGTKYNKAIGKAKGKAIGLYSKPTKIKAKMDTEKAFPKVKQPIIAPHELGWY